MGSKTKSWLALALAIVMVLGMGIPAYAAPAAGGTGIGFTVSGIQVANPHIMTLGDGAQTVNMHDTNAAGLQLTDLYLGQTPKVTISTTGTTSYIPYVKVEVANGALVLTPLEQTPGIAAVAFTVKVESSNTDGSWSPTDSSLTFPTGGYYQQTFNFRVRADLVATPKAVDLDINGAWANNVGTYVVSSTSSETVSDVRIESVTRTTGNTSMFGANANPITAGTSSGTPANGTLAIGGTNGRTLTVTAPTTTTNTGSGVIRLRATIGGAFAYVDIPYNIGYTATATAAHHIALSHETLDLRTDGVTGTIIPTVVDKNGLIPNPAYTGTLSLLGGNGTSGSTAGVATATINASGDIIVTPVAAGTTTFTMQGTAGIQAKTFTVTVSKMTVTAMPDPFTVDVNEYGIANNNGLDEAIITFSPVGTGTVDATNATIASTYPAGRFALMSRAGLSANQIKVKATAAQVAAGAGVGTITVNGIKLNNQNAESVTVKFVANDTTVRPQIFAKRNDGTLIGDTITMDRQNGDVSQQIVFTPSGSKISSLSYTLDPAVTAALAPIGAATPANFNGIVLATASTHVDSATLKLDSNTSALGTAKLKVSGSVDGVAITPYTITINVINSNLATINKLNANKTSIAQAVTANTFTFTAWAENNFGTRIALLEGSTTENAVNNQSRLRLEASVVYDTGYTTGLTITQPAVATPLQGRLDGVFNFSTSAPCKGKIVVELREGYRPTDANGNSNRSAMFGVTNRRYPVPTLEIPFAIGDVMIQGSADEVVLDLKDADSSKTEFTITPVDAGTSLTNSTLVASPMVGAANNLVLAKKAGAAEGVWTISTGTTAAAGQWGYLDIGGTVNGKAATAVKRYRYEIKNSRGLKANKSLFEFNLSAANGVKQENLVITPVPTTEALTVTSVKADVDTFVTVTNTANDTSKSTWLISAKAPGTGTITITGKVNNVAVDPITVTYNVVQAAAIVTANPATVALDIRENSTTKSQTVTFHGPLTTDVVAVTSITSDKPAVATVASTSPYVITGVSVGTANVTAKVTLNGVAVADVVIPVTVTSAAAEPTGMMIGGTVYPITNGIVNAKMSVNTTEALFMYLVGPNGERFAANRISGYDSSKNPLLYAAGVDSKPVKARTISNSIFAADVRDGLIYYKAKGVGYWMLDLDFGTNKSVKLYVQNVDGNATDVTIPTIPTLHAGERFDLRGALVITPADANRNTLKYKVQNNGVLGITVTGILKANKAGTAKVQVLNSKKTRVLATATVTVDDNYSGINFASAYFFQDNNTDKAEVVKILGAAKFSSTSTTHAPYEVQAPTAAAFETELKALAATLAASGTLGRDDIFTFYYSGNVNQKGIKFADGNVVTFDELAVIAGSLPCQAFMIFDCDYSGSFISKGAIQNGLFKAVAKQNAAYAKTVGAAGNGKAKLHVLLATSTLEQSIPDVATTGGQKELTKAFVKALTKGTDGELGMGGFSVNLYNLRKEINRTADTTYATIGMYPLPRNGDSYPIYAIEALYTAN